MSDFRAIVLSQVWTRSDDGLLSSGQREHWTGLNRSLASLGFCGFFSAKFEESATPFVYFFKCQKKELITEKENGKELVVPVNLPHPLSLCHLLFFVFFSERLFFLHITAENVYAKAHRQHIERSY